MKRLPVVNLVLIIGTITALIFMGKGFIESHKNLRLDLNSCQKTVDSVLRVSGKMVQYGLMAERRFQVIDKRIQGNAVMSDYALAEAEASSQKAQEVNALARELKARITRLEKRRPRSYGGQCENVRIHMRPVW